MGAQTLFSFFVCGGAKASFSYGSDDEFGEDVEVEVGNETDDDFESSDEEPLAPGLWKDGSFEQFLRLNKL